MLEAGLLVLRAELLLFWFHGHGWLVKAVSLAMLFSRAAQSAASALAIWSAAIVLRGVSSSAQCICCCIPFAQVCSGNHEAIFTEVRDDLADAVPLPEGDHAWQLLACCAGAVFVEEASLFRQLQLLDIEGKFEKYVSL